MFGLSDSLITGVLTDLTVTAVDIENEVTRESSLALLFAVILPSLHPIIDNHA